MYTTGPPLRAGGSGPAGPVPLRISWAGRRVFDETSQAAFDPQLRVFMADLVRPYGLALREDLLREGAGHSYGEMAEPLLRAALPAGEPVDLVVTAFAVHDVRPGRATAAYLSSLCAGEPMAFSVTDQGPAAAFTALRLVGDYARTGGCRRALLFVLEQAALHYVPAAPAPLPDRHSAVALLLGGSGPGALAVPRLRPGVSAARAGDLLAAELAELTDLTEPTEPTERGGRAGRAGRASSGGVTVVLGPGLADAVPATRVAAGPAVERVVVAPAGQPCTGVWWELAGGLPAWASGGGRVLLADYDADLGYLCTSTVEFP